MSSIHLEMARKVNHTEGKPEEKTLQLSGNIIFILERKVYWRHDVCVSHSVLSDSVTHGL